MSAVAMTVNGKPSPVTSTRRLLVQFLRENLPFLSHVGCDTSQCGACVVHVNGKAVKACTVFAWQLEGADVLTIEGLAEPSRPLHPMREAFREHQALQCGFLAPSMIMTAVDMVNRKGNDLDDPTIRHELEGNLCRCTGYHNIVKAIAAGAKAMAKGRTTGQHVDLAITGEEETAMSATGIGAAVRRKEDLHHRQGSLRTTSAVRVRPMPISCARPMPAKIRKVDARRPPPCRACSRCSPAPDLPPTRSAISFAAG